MGIQIILIINILPPQPYLCNNYIMTRVNLVLPFFETSLQTNNSQVVSQILTQKYGLKAQNIYWIDPPIGTTLFQCVVRIKDLSVNADSISELIQRNKSIEQTLKHMKTDIFNVVAKYTQLQNSKKQTQFQKVKQHLNNYQDSEVSLKIEQKSKLNEGRQRQSEYSQGQLMKAVSQLTRQNLKLKDAIVYYQAQFQFFVKWQEQAKKQVK